MSPDDRPIAEDAYDELAEAYREHEDDPYCSDLEFPAMVDLVPEVDGKRILDAGCGYGRYSEWLLDHGADVVAFDTSEKMVDGARERIGDRATVLRADMERPLDVADDDAFDGVVSGLSLHYVEDWRRPFAEFSRLLRPGGFLAFSAHHPLDDYLAYEGVNYFETERERMTWTSNGGDVDVPFYHRPFSEIINPLLETGFQLDELVEPTPTATFEGRKPESYEKRLKRPTFVCIRASKR
ncbi:class I SAM-dependent methyltransferase [Haladaptatus sp. AB643]|uniref:class I SAM-dependent methyltransferase n=1 Tax=Haladaptatus sp. AB643 TaxID=2934174 RepID=UPI00209C4447|nr:class I SAM-dependent methyltransferase [Haladaptatus sp. AB643]MCO8243262.1 class I SAM-dependent methyltransferase [Haladaptatus sp. AB643]